jgi:hypothetical protein
VAKVVPSNPVNELRMVTLTWCWWEIEKGVMGNLQQSREMCSRRINYGVLSKVWVPKQPAMSRNAKRVTGGRRLPRPSGHGLADKPHVVDRPAPKLNKKYC